MLDNQLINLVATKLEAASASAGWNYIVVQKDQPTQQGVPTEPTIFFEKLFDIPFGWPMASDVYQAANNTFLETETQLYNTTFQISALVIQDPTNLELPTASDVANYMMQSLTSRSNILAFQQVGVSVLRVTSVRNPAFSDDRAMFEYNPNFDIVVTHNRTVSSTVNSVSTGTIGLAPV
jgi:hypothetical protein